MDMDKKELRERYEKLDGIAKQNVPDARTGFSQRIPLPLLYHKGRGIYISKLFLYQKIKFKERKR